MLKVEKDQTDIPTLDFTEELIRELAEIKLYSKVPTASMPVYHVSHSIIPIFDDKKRNYSDLPLNGNEKSGSDQQKIGIWGEKSGSWSNRLQKEITHPKRRLFVV